MSFLYTDSLEVNFSSLTFRGYQTSENSFLVFVGQQLQLYFTCKSLLQVTFQDDGHLVGASEVIYRGAKIRKTTIMFHLIPSKIICPISLSKLQLVPAISRQSLT